MKLIAILTFHLIGLSTFSQTNNSVDLIKYTTNLYTVQYPATWKIDSSKHNGVEFAIFSQKESDEDKFMENINLLIQDLSGLNIDLDKYAQISERQIKENAKDLKGFIMKKSTDRSPEFYFLTYEMTYRNFNLFTEQYYFIKNEKAFVITFSAESIKSKANGEKILESFTLAK